MKQGWRFSWLDNFLHVICHHKPPVGVFVQMNLGKAYKLHAGHNITVCEEKKRSIKWQNFTNTE